MNRRDTIAVLSSLMIGAALTLPARAVNLLANGSFETWTGGDESSSAQQPDRIFNNGSATFVVPGWNMNIGLSSDLYRDLNAAGALSNYYDAQDGDYLAGSGSFFTTHEGISQTFVVAPNTLYKLTFQMAPGGLNYNGAWIENATVGSHWNVQITGALASNVNQNFASNLAHFNASGTTNPLVWSPRSKYFTSDAIGGLATLQFRAFGDMTHIFLDNVVVEGATVPQPSAALALFTAIPIVACMRQRAIASGSAT
jgi:hypothetical protein